jgi:hypothetical protein
MQRCALLHRCNFGQCLCRPLSSSPIDLKVNVVTHPHSCCFITLRVLQRVIDSTVQLWLLSYDLAAALNFVPLAAREMIATTRQVISEYKRSVEYQELFGCR